MTTKNFLFGTLVWCLLGVITAILETPWNFGSAAVEKHLMSRTRRLVALDDNSAPYVLTATLSPDASYCIVAFDQPTNQGGYSSTFPCTDYFSFTNADVASCSWKDSETILIYPNLSPQYVATAFTVGSQLTLSGNAKTFSAACASSATPSSCLPVSFQSISILGPVPVTPTVSIATAPSISSCLDWTLSLTGSAGDGHRGWTKPASYIKITASDKSVDTTSLQAYLTSQFQTQTPIVVPKTYLTVGATYTIAVHLCNILGGCGDGGATVQVNSGSKSAPAVSLTGPATSSFYSSNALSVTAVAGVTSCDGTTTSVGLSYSWAVTSGTGDAVKFSNPQSRKNQISVAQNTLTPGQTYTVAVTVTDSSSKLSSTASVVVSVSRSPLVAAINPSTMQLFRVDASSQLVLNGKASSDPDDPQNQTPLTYSWSCVSQGLTSCALNTGSTSQSTLTITGSDSSMVGSVSTFTLTVSKDSRTASATVVVRAIAGSAPVVNITSPVSSLTQIDTTSPVLIGASVTASSSVSCAWSTDAGSAFDITKASTPLTKTIPVGASIYSLYLPGNLMPIRSTYHFTLTCASSAATVTVTTNGPPVPGTLSITPTTGTEMTTPFAYTAASWTDPDLPVTYLFGFIDVISGQVKSVQSRSTLSYGTSGFPAGSSTAANALTAVVVVYDAYNASASLNFQLTVAPLPTAQVASTISSQLAASQSSTNLDDLKSVISIASSMINRVDCSSAPTCSTLNRSPCQATANTCGSCLTGYIGQSGDSNSKCVSSSSASSAASIPQTCPGNGCSGHGTCTFTLNGNSVKSCTVADGLACVPVCSCASGYGGNDCSMTASAVTSDQTLRSSLLNSLSLVQQGDDVSASSVSNVVSNVAGIVQSSSSVNSDGLTTFGSLAQSTLSNALSDNTIPASLLSGLLGPLDAAISAHAANRRRRLTVTSTNGNPAPVDADSAMNYGDSILSSFADLVSRDSAPGVPAASYSFGNFRLAQQTVSGGSSASLSVPLTDAESAAGQSTSSVSVDTSSTTSNDAVSLSLAQYSSALLATEGSKYSNVLSGQFSAGSTVTVTLANIAGDAGPVATPAEAFTSVCAAKSYETTTHTCSASGAVLTHKCTGVAGKITSYCPVLKTACSNVNLGSGSSDYQCSLSSITTSAITCKCTFSRRRLDAGTVAQQVGIMNMVAITEFIGNEVDQTFNAAPDLTSPAAIEKSLIVIIMYCVLWVSGLLMLGGCIYRQRKMKQIRLEQKLEKLQTNERNSQMSSIEDVREKLVTYVQAVFPIIFYSDHWLVRLKDEIRRNHSYMMLFNSVDGELEDKKRILNGLKLLTAQTALMFLLALLYDLQGPTDDGTCVTYTTQAACLNQHSILDNTQNYCTWSPQDDANQPCQFNNAGISFKASLYIQVIVSVFTALLMRPLAYGFDILLAPSVDHMKEKKEEEKRLYNLTSQIHGDNEVGREKPETKRSSLTALFSAPEEDPELQELAKVLVTLIPDDVEIVSKQAKSYFKRINNTSNPMQRAAPATTHESHGSSETPVRTNRNSLYNKMRSTITFVANKVMHRSEEETVQILFNELKEKIHAQRSALSGEELVEFDREWGLDGAGNFLRNDLHIKGKKDVSEVILKEVRKVEHETHEDVERLKMAIDHHIGLEILHKFILDVLGRDTPAGYIFAGKTEEDFKKSPVRSFRLKVFVSVILVAANALFIYYSVLRGYVQGVDWQKQYLVACIIQMVLEIYLFETFECIWINVMVPSLVASEVQRVNRLLLGIIDDICEKAATGEKLEITDRSHVLDATQYLYMSSRLANAYPHLMESMIVRTYHTHLPGELAYKWLATDHSFAASYRRFFGRTSSSDTSFMIAAIGAMLATIQIVAFIPFDFQKMIVRFFQPFLFGGLVLLWQIIVASTMGIIITVIVLTVVIVLVVWHYYSHYQAKEQENEAKITPLDEMAVKNSEGHIAMQKVKSVRVRSANNESSYNSNDITENQSVDSFGVEHVRGAALVGEDDDTIDQLHYPAHPHPHHSPKKTKGKKHSPSKSKSSKHATNNNNNASYELVTPSAPVEVDIDALINDFKNAEGDDESDDGSYRLSLSDHDDQKSDN